MRAEISERLTRTPAGVLMLMGVCFVLRTKQFSWSSMPLMFGGIFFLVGWALWQKDQVIDVWYHGENPSTDYRMLVKPGLLVTLACILGIVWYTH